MKVNRSVVFVGAVILGLAPLAWALPTQDSIYYYYSDSTFRTEVGSKVATTCSGAHGSTVGTATRYYVIEHESCPSLDVQEVHCMIDGVQTYCPKVVCDSFGMCN